MGIILEKHGTSRHTLDTENIEPFTQNQFIKLLRDSKTSHQDYFICLITTDNNIQQCYDARQACRYIFEIVISPDCRKIRVKNFKDPLTHNKIKDVTFYRLRYDTENLTRAEFMGTYIDFMESNCFRSKLFSREDPLYTLSVSFNFKEIKGMPMFGRKQVLSLFITVMFILLIGTFVVLVLERKNKGFIFDWGVKKKIGSVKPVFVGKTT